MHFLSHETFPNLIFLKSLKPALFTSILISKQSSSSLSLLVSLLHIYCHLLVSGTVRNHWQDCELHTHKDVHAQDKQNGHLLM